MKQKSLRFKTISFLLSTVLIMACLPTSAIALDMNSSNDLETRLDNNNLDTIYCSQCLSTTHEKGIFTHLNAHHWKN